MTSSDALKINHESDLTTLNEAYTALLIASDSYGAFPGSKAWRACLPYSNALNALIAARPDLEPYRAEVAAAKRAEALKGVDIAGL